MSLPWIRLDAGLPSHPKILQLTASKQYRACAVYAFGLCYSGAHGTDGFLPEVALPLIHGTQREANELVEATLWHPCMGGWQINGWSEFQPSSKEHANRRDSLRRSSAKGNCVRHHGPDCGCWAR